MNLFSYNSRFNRFILLKEGLNQLSSIMAKKVQMNEEVRADLELIKHDC